MLVRKAANVLQALWRIPLTKSTVVEAIVNEARGHRPPETIKPHLCVIHSNHYR